MFKQLCLILIAAFIIPQGVSWKTWLNMWPDLEKIVACESNFNPKAVGDHGKSFGIFQIHLPAHKEVTKKQALDPYFSLAWAIEKYHNGEIGIWSCYHILIKKGEMPRFDL